MKYSVGTGCRGLTLIEVVASIVLVSTLLVMILEGWSRHRRQIELAKTKKEAALALDRMLGDWFSQTRPFPVDQLGQFSDYPRFVWRSQLVFRQRTNPAWEIATLRVSVHSRDRPAIPLASVDLLVDAASMHRGTESPRGDQLQ